jgi:hypothetical protein
MVNWSASRMRHARRWHWPGPFGGPLAVTLIVLVFGAAAAAVAVHPVRPTGKLSPPRAAPAPRPAGGPDPLFAPPAEPTGQPLSDVPSYPDTPTLSAPPPPPDPDSPAPPRGGSSGGGSSGGGSSGGGSSGAGGFDRGQPPFPVTGPEPASFIAVTGTACPAAAVASYFAAYPAGVPVANLSGGWVNRRCNDDRVWSVPMSGSADRDDPGTFVLWWFVTAPIVSGACDIWVYVPKPGRPADAAGDPTHYDVLRSDQDRTVIGTFSVEQPAHRGSWVKGGTFGFDGGRIAVRLDNRGTGTGGARHGAAEVLVRCKPPR